MTFTGGAPVVPPANDGPVPVMLASELALARSGAIDADLIAQQAFYGTNYTLPLMFLNDGMYYSGLAQSMNLTGSQWGVMNETGSYPGQPWLWLYQLWYQLPGFRTSANADLIAIYLTGAPPSCCWPSRSSPACATSPAGSPSTSSSGETGTSKPPAGPPARPNPNPPDRSRPLRSGP